MGFLDDLKRQAQERKAAQAQAKSIDERKRLLTDAACKTVFQYWLQLAPQLEVLQPLCRARFAIDNRHVLSGLRCKDFRVDARRAPVDGQEGYDHVVLYWTLASGQHLELRRDFVADIERLEARLHQAGIRADMLAVRDPNNGKLQEMQYRFDADIAGSVRLLPDYENARVQFQIHNLEGLDTVTLDFAAFEIGSARLDELAKWLVGEPHGFLDGAKNLRRRSPP